MDKKYLSELPPPIPNEALEMNKHSWFMGFAEQAAKKSPDQETKVGAALVNYHSGSLMAIGFNGFIRGANDNSLPKVRPHKYPYMVHAEMNLIANCARHGISMKECVLYCTMSPCITCMRALFNAGIKHIYVKQLYKDFPTILDMKDLKVEIKETKNGYFLLGYEPYV